MGAEDDSRLSVTERTFERCLGIVHDGRDGLVLAGFNAIWQFGNVLPAGQSFEGHDALYVPQIAWFTGDVFAHDVGVATNRRALFVNTLFSCLSAVDEESSFRPVWVPPFVSALAPEDRCHLNGLAMDAAGAPRFVTAAAATDRAGAWREQREAGGVVIDVASGEIVCRGLSMPHSPRLRDDTLLVLSAGAGELGRVDLAAGRFEPIAFLPGFARGLALLGDHALVGLSLPRANRVFADLPLEKRLSAGRLEAQCAVAVVDLTTGRTLHWLRLGGVVRELYDIAILPHARRPMLVGLQGRGGLNRLITRGPDLPLAALLGGAA